MNNSIFQDTSRTPFFGNVVDLLKAHNALVDSINFREGIRDGLLKRLMVGALHAARMSREFGRLPLNLQEAVLAAEDRQSPKEALELLVLLIKQDSSGGEGATGSENGTGPVSDILRFLQDDHRQLCLDFWASHDPYSEAMSGQKIPLDSIGDRGISGGLDSSKVVGSCTTPDAPLEPLGASEAPSAQQLKG